MPPEYRLFFDAPILAAYRYTSRPFNLQLVLSPLSQYETLGQVVDRASLNTSISKEGQVVTDARYFVKNRGVPNFRLTLPEGAELWSATVNDNAVVPVADQKANLIPLPQRADPNAVVVLDLKMAARSKNPDRVRVAAPIVSAPVMLAEWKLEPDTGQRLVYRQGSLTPAGGVADVSGFVGLTRTFSGRLSGQAWAALWTAIVLVVLAMLAWRWASAEPANRFSVRHIVGAVIGLLLLAGVGAALIVLGRLAEEQSQLLPRQLTFLAPVQQSGSALTVDLANISDKASGWSSLGYAWPVLLALIVWGYGLVTSRKWFRPVAWILGWTLLAWAVLRWPNGAPALFGLAGLFLLIHIVGPGVWRWWRTER